MDSIAPPVIHQCSTEGHFVQTYAKPNIYKCTRCTRFIHQLGDRWYAGIGTGSFSSRGYQQAIKEVVLLDPMEPEQDGKVESACM